MAAELDQFTEQQLAIISPMARRSNALKGAAELMVVTDDVGMNTAKALQKDLNNHSKEVKDFRLGVTRQLDNVSDQLRAKEREILAPVEEAKTILSEKIITYTDEVARKRYEEDARIQKIVDTIEDLYRPGMTKGQVETARAAAKKMVAEIAKEDGALPRVNLAFLTLSNQLQARATDIGIEEQRAKKQKLQADEQRVEDERRELEKRKAAALLAEAQLEADKAKAKEEAARPKSNIVENTDYEVIDESAVPDFLKTTDLKKVREYGKAYPGKEIPGIKITKTRKSRG